MQGPLRTGCDLLPLKRRQPGPGAAGTSRNVKAARRGECFPGAVLVWAERRKPGRATSDLQGGQHRGPFQSGRRRSRFSCGLSVICRCEGRSFWKAVKEEGWRREKLRNEGSLQQQEACSRLRAGGPAELTFGVRSGLSNRVHAMRARAEPCAAQATCRHPCSALRVPFRRPTSQRRKLSHRDVT